MKESLILIGRAILLVAMQLAIVGYILWAGWIIVRLSLPIPKLSWFSAIGLVLVIQSIRIAIKGVSK